MDDASNYGRLRVDEASGLPFITDVATGQRLYKLPPCLLCGAAPWSWTPEPVPACGCCDRTN
jgi:hypothetical protein